MIDSVSTRVKALWNDKGLMVLYHCLDADIQATVTERDGRVYTDDAVELFLDPDMDGARTTYRWRSIPAARGGTSSSLEAVSRTSTLKWDSGLLCAVAGERTVLDLGPGRVVDGGAVSYPGAAWAGKRWS